MNALKGALGGGARGLLMGLLRAILPIGMALGGAALASDRPGAGYSALNVLARGLEGAGFGLLSRNWIATAIGALAGIGYGIWENYQPKPEDDAAKQTAENTKRMADGMEQLRMQVIGGGIRTRRGASDIEAQINLSRAMATLSGV
jgi:hypothetical protein